MLLFLALIIETYLELSYGSSRGATYVAIELQLTLIREEKNLTRIYKQIEDAKKCNIWYLPLDTTIKAKLFQLKQCCINKAVEVHLYTQPILLILTSIRTEEVAAAPHSTKI